MKKSSLVKTEALILKTFPYRETSLIVRFFSKDIGRYSFVAKGIKRGKKHFSINFEPFSHFSLTLYLKENSDLATLKEAHLIDSFYYLRQSLEKIAISSLFFEIIDKSTISTTENDSLFDLSLLFLKQLRNSQQILSWSSFCLFKVIEILGFRPNLSFCMLCPKKNITAPFYFAPSQGRFICENCFLNLKKTGAKRNLIMESIIIDSSIQDDFLFCIKENIDNGICFRGNPQNEQKLLKIALSILSHNLETDFKSQIFWEKVFAP